MSLKAFHILFISVSTVLGVGLVYWGFKNYLLTSELSSLFLGFIGVVMMPTLFLYAKYFLKKTKNVDVWK